MNSKHSIVIFSTIVYLICINISCTSSTEPEKVLEPVDDLKMIVGLPTSALISWTAPQSEEGLTPYSYELRFDTVKFEESADWISANSVAGLPTPASGGTVQQFLLEDLEPNRTYYTMMQVKGLHGRTSKLSNQIRISTSDTASLSIFSADDLYGNNHSISEFYGEELVLVNFWGYWCYWCTFEMPDIIQLHNQFADDGLVIVGFNYGDEVSTALNYAEQMQMPWVNLMVSADICREYQVRAFPTTVFLDSTGKQIGRLRGSQSFEIFSMAVRYLLGDSANSTIPP